MKYYFNIDIFMNHKLYKSLLLIVMVSLSILEMSGQSMPYQNKSPKPTSLESALSGFSNYDFDGEDGDVDFLEAYFIAELRKWMEAVRPGIRFGTDFSKPSPEHVTISYDYSYRTQLANNGVWWWIASDAKVIFTIAGLDYEYEYRIPNFSVQGNNFSNHVLYDNLLKSVGSHVYQYNRLNTLHLADYRSGYDEAKIKSIWKTEGCKLFEGIYEDVASDNGRKKNKYKLAMKYINDKPCLIYLDGANLFDDWKEGEYKAWLEPTSTANIFKAQWLMADKSSSSAYVSFENGAMRTSISSTNENNVYIKLFPSATDNISIADAPANEWTGTGFALKDNYIVTNYHVVDGAKSISIKGINGNFVKGCDADVIATDKQNDLAILKVNGVTIQSVNIPYSVKTNTAEVGEEVFVLGYPLTSTMGDEIKLTTGVVSSRSGFQGDVSLYQISAPIQPGNSGGPLFDSKGNVIGIVSAKHKGAENVSYAIKASYLRNLMESSLTNNILPQNTKLATLNLSGKVKSAKNFVYYIICSSKVINGNNSKQSSLSTVKKTNTNTNMDPDLEKAKSYTSSADLHYHIKEYANAVELLQKAVNLGYAEAQYKLGYMYQYGQGVKKNYIKALELYKKAADQDYVDALCNIGYMYEYGLGVNKNLGKAIEWYQKGAERGDAVSQDNLGIRYESGMGVKRNYAKAFELYLKAAEQGYAKGQYHVGCLYEKGLGVNKNLSKAIEWYKKASGNGNDDAEEALRRLEK